MIYAITASKDATLYKNESDSDVIEQNTGRDQILELIKDITTSLKFNSRIIINFDTSSVSNSILNNDLDYYLKLTEANSHDLVTDFNIYVHPLSGSWTNGNGTFSDEPIITNGVSWKYRYGDDEDIIWNTSSYTAGTTGSLTGGGNWYTDVSVSKNYDYNDTNLNIDVTDIVDAGHDNFLIKYSNSEEDSDEDVGYFRFFSKETHTVYEPKLVLKYDDSSYNTGSLELFTSSYNTSVQMDNLNYMYDRDSYVKFRLNVNREYEETTYNTSFTDSGEQYCLPSSSFYAIEDVYTGDKIVDFDEDYTKLSCNSNGNYFNFYMNQLYPNRYYKILIKSKYSDNTISIYDNKYYFKVD